MAKKNIKEEQGYQEKPIFPMCSNCANFRSEFIPTNYGYNEEKNIRCGIGGFAVKKMGTCTKHEPKTK